MFSSCLMIHQKNQLHRFNYYIERALNYLKIFRYLKFNEFFMFANGKLAIVQVCLNTISLLQFTCIWKRKESPQQIKRFLFTFSTMFISCIHKKKLSFMLKIQKRSRSFQLVWRSAGSKMCVYLFCVVRSHRYVVSFIIMLFGNLVCLPGQTNLFYYQRSSSDKDSSEPSSLFNQW